MAWPPAAPNGRKDWAQRWRGPGTAAQQSDAPDWCSYRVHRYCKWECRECCSCTKGLAWSSSLPPSSGWCCRAGWLYHFLVEWWWDMLQKWKKKTKTSYESLNEETPVMLASNLRASLRLDAHKLKTMWICLSLTNCLNLQKYKLIAGERKKWCAHTNTQAGYKQKHKSLKMRHAFCILQTDRRTNSLWVNVLIFTSYCLTLSGWFTGWLGGWLALAGAGVSATVEN